MAVAVDSLRYNSLLSLGEANIARQAPSVHDTINGPIRDVFVRHGVQNIFCLYLQHRHHTVGEGQAVVKVNGTAHLMDRQAMNDIVSFGHKIVPTTWMTSDGKVIPMEFTVTSSSAESPCPGPDFIAELISVLSTNECSGLFGIDTIASCAWAEMAIGDASVVVPDNLKNVSQATAQESFIPVAFLFDDTAPNFRVHGRCKKGQHSHTSKPGGK